jgi:putative redox protein
MALSDDTTQPLEGVEVSETGLGRYQAQVRAGGAVFLADEPVAAGGLGSGPNPYDLLGAALGACTTMTVRLYAERKGWPLDSVIVRVLHRRPSPEAKDQFAREIVLQGELSPDQRRRLLEIAEHCPVHQTLERGAQVVTVLAEHAPAGGLDPAPLGHAAAMAAACETLDRANAG